MSSFRPNALFSRVAAPVLLALALGGACASAQAAITCVFTTSSIAFGDYDPSVAAPTDGSGTVGVNCTHDSTGNNTVDVVLSMGGGLYGSIANRQMQSSAGGNLLLYNLYRDAARTLVWGNTPGTDTSKLTINGIAKSSSKTGSFTVLGRIPPQQNIAAGSYADSVVISITP